MAGFSNLALASQHLDDVLKSVFVGMVPCSGLGHFEDETEKWEEIINAKINEVKFLNSKAILVNASLQKGSQQNVGGDRHMALENLSKGLDSRLRWGRMQQKLALSNAFIYGHWSPQNTLLVKDLVCRLDELQQCLDRVERLEAERFLEMNAAADKWQRTTAQHAERRESNLAKKKIKEPTDETLLQMINKLETMRIITSKLMVAAQTYDWAKDKAHLVRLLPKLRNETYTTESFL